MAKTKEVVITNPDELVAIRFAMPTIGTKIVLKDALIFDLYREHRNFKLWQALYPEDKTDPWRTYGVELAKKSVILPPGSVLSVSRIYIRSHFREFDSLTFWCTQSSDKRFKGKRFWMKLRDVNKIVCYPLGSDPKAVPEADVFVSFGQMGKRFLDLGA